ncbi:MarR family winged helix-turn-helix transcriptional regulator [Peptostreptococcus faecalis]|uniref:MarR family winged helix-turn-helix transcriptional regulator n=1 Tax=Peptostreptococcus faecalis TaxID=2045015 RepID=UPI000C7DE4C5|nr:MarR family transcriptional regulator [Peptostreptococcus faecalis]
MKKNSGRLVSFLHRKCQMYKNIHLKELNITAAEQPFMSALYSQDGVSQEYLSSYLSIDKASTARVIDSLLKKGFIIKKKDLEDKRVNRIYLSEKGLSIKSEVKSILNDWGMILTNDMSEEEKEIAYSYLERMVNNIDTYIKEKNNIKE